MSDKLDQWEKKVAALFEDVANFSPEEQKKAKHLMRSLGTENKSTEPLVNQEEHDFIAKTLSEQEPD
ncbi:MAG: hypothetical protein COA45_02050 [Zetaproteobacteria bacterium]|nr:MAG: hypothetical protein COA45_02050 [Zetaproteobacteria bacterium]